MSSPPGEPAADLLASYPHVAGCPACRAYAQDRAATHPRTSLVSATLAHHDAQHLADPYLVASQHFAFDWEPALA
jgi:hypothetical protein